MSGFQAANKSRLRMSGRVPNGLHVHANNNKKNVKYWNRLR